MPERLREDEAIDVRGSGSGGETTQVVFDLDSGEFSTGEGIDEQRVAADGRHDGATETAAESLDHETETVLDELSGLNVNETPPVELMAKVREWQAELDEYFRRSVILCYPI